MTNLITIRENALISAKKKLIPRSQSASNSNAASEASLEQFSCRLHFVVSAQDFETLKRLASKVAHIEDTFCDDANYTLCRRNSWYKERSSDDIFVAVMKDAVIVDDHGLVVATVEEHEHGTKKFQEWASTYSRVLFHLYTTRYTLTEGVWLDDSEFHVGDERSAYRILTVDPSLHNTDDDVHGYLGRADLLVCGTARAVAKLYELPVQDDKHSHLLLERSRQAVHRLPELPKAPPIVLEAKKCYDEALAAGLSTETWCDRKHEKQHLGGKLLLERFIKTRADK